MNNLLANSNNAIACSLVTEGKSSKKESMITELVQFVRGKPNEEKKKIVYAYFEKKEYEKKRKLH